MEYRLESEDTILVSRGSNCLTAVQEHNAYSQYFGESSTVAKNESGKGKLKNHITSLDTKTLQKVASERFGYGIDDLNAVLQGNESKAQEIAEFGRQGRLTQKYAPIVAQSIMDGIEGTKVLNVETAKILKAAGSADTAILKAGKDSLLANQKYSHEKVEIAAEYGLAKQQEQKRHDYAKTYIELKYLYDSYFLSVDQDARLQEQSYRPDMKQLQEDETAKQRRLDHLLAYGDRADTGLLVERDYAQSSFNGSGILGTVKGFINSVKQSAGF